MNNPLAFNAFFSLLGVLGLYLLASGLIGLARRPNGDPNVSRFAGRLGGGGRDSIVVSDLPPLAQRALARPMADLGRALFGSDDPGKALSVEDRLRRAGWRYTSVGDFYGSKVAGGVMLFALGALAAAVLGLSPALALLAAGGAGVAGLYTPDLELAKVTEQRRLALFREMAWSLDRIALVLETGQAFEKTVEKLLQIRDEVEWISRGAGGLFTALLRDVAVGVKTRRENVDPLLDDLRATLPLNMPEVDEFLGAVRATLREAQPIAPQLRALGASMRVQLNQRIDKLAQDTEIKVVAITSGIVVPALLVVVGGGALVGLVGLIQGF